MTSVFQLTDRLDYRTELVAEEFQIVMTEERLERVKTAVLRYLHGQGHPFPERAEALIGREKFSTTSQDPLYRACRFIKTTSGLVTLPTDRERNFTVSLFSVFKTLYSRFLHTL